MKYFNSCTTLNEVKSLYKTLAKQYHPDITGEDTTAIMQCINVEYAFCIAKIAKGENLTANEVEAEILNAEQYRQAVDAIINLQGITIELCGGWIWVSGLTYQHREILKNAKFYFAGKKKMWYFRGVEYATANKRTHSMDEIRTKYGSQQISTSRNSYQLA